MPLEIRINSKDDIEAVVQRCAAIKEAASNTDAEIEFLVDELLAMNASTSLRGLFQGIKVSIHSIAPKLGNQRYPVPHVRRFPKWPSCKKLAAKLVAEIEDLLTSDVNKREVCEHVEKKLAEFQDEIARQL
jgi:hypothetical protein